MIKNRNVAFALFVVLFMVVWNLMDYLYSVFIAGGTYHFAGGADLVLPLAAAITLGYLFFLRNKTE